ncbi:MAG TPA: hypothetical protein VMZ27_12465 [Candidatus Saccharimonadales bacterium]|nr:hypothetical protein [Candidatus Saccharimonadales bacterium]
MKAKFSGLICGFMVLSFCARCFGMMDIMDVSREQAKACGVTIRTNLNGQAGVRVWMEFKPEGKFRQFRNVELQVGEGGKRVMTATLQDSALKSGNLSVNFSVQPQYLAESTLMILVDDQPLGGSGYRFRMKDFIALSYVPPPMRRRAQVSAMVATNEWSPATNGLQARLKLGEQSKLFGTRWLVPHLELRNVRDLANPMEVQCDGPHLKVELVDGEGNPVRDGQIMRRSGPVPKIGTVSLPFESSMQISLECRNWGVSMDASAMISTDSGAWVLKESERGKVFLRATLTGEKAEPYWKRWYGVLQTPLLKMDW